MEYVYYKGKRYEAKAVEIGGNLLYSLFNEEGRSNWIKDR
jgi:hypothetical protein